MKKFFTAICIVCLPALSFAQQQSIKPAPLITEDSLAQKEWVDSLYTEMSVEEKIGQLFISKPPQDNPDLIKEHINKYHIGGVIFSTGGPKQQAQLTNAYQEESDIPLLITQDAEWGLAMRLDSTYAFPWNMTLGAVEDNDLIRQTGKRIAQQAKRLGVHLDFAPDVDININPNNPIIGNRSFGEDRENVTQKGLSFVRGMESQNVLANIKHFPGHGDTDVDSHKALPVLDFSKRRLDSIELYPYKKIIPKGVSSIIIGHLDVPALEDHQGRPVSLSKSIVTDLLKQKLNYTGLIITDGLGMQGVANTEDPGKASLDAFLAGNDVLLNPRSIPDSYNRVLKAYKADMFSEDRLEHSVKKILRAKYKVGLNKPDTVDTTDLVKDLNTTKDDLLYAKLMENAITMIKNKQDALPITSLDEKKTAYVPLGDANGDPFYKRLNKYDQVNKVEASTLNELMEKLNDYNQVIVGFHKSNEDPWQDYKFTAKEQKWLAKITANYPTILNVFASPYALLGIENTNNLDGIIIGYQNSKIAQQKTADILYGSIGAKGKLPVSLGDEFPANTKIKTTPIKRLSYGLPESVGMDSKKLKKVDSIAKFTISEEMTPGLQVLVARKGRVVFQKSYGYHTYTEQQKVKNEDLYDLASMTKILATLPMLMEQYDQGNIQLNTKLKTLLPYLKNSNKANITLKKALSHYARFKPYISFQGETLNSEGGPSAEYYKSSRDSIYNTKITENLYLRSDYLDTVYAEIADSPLENKIEYKYSGLPFLLFKKYLETYYDLNLNALTQAHFYKSLGANSLGFLPLQRFDKSQIVPTVDDKTWRSQLLQGLVHDGVAALFGGISGNAGLFGNANDVAKMSQMYLNEGAYGGHRYFTSKTMDTFNTCYYCNENVNRGLGFHKPQFEGDPGPVFDSISKKSFGHTGFTGTITWVDPKEELVYVLLSNRVASDQEKQLEFLEKDIRKKIQKLVYKAIMTY